MTNGKSSKAGESSKSFAGPLIGIGVLVVVLVLVFIFADSGKCIGQLSADPGDVMNGTFDWATLDKEAAAFSYDGAQGEPDHLLWVGGAPSKAKATIDPVSKGSTRKASCFDQRAVVVAKITADADFSSLEPDEKGMSLTQGVNYFVVWMDAGSDWHGATVNQKERIEVKPFKYEEHWRGNKPPDPDDPAVPLPDEVSKSVKECWKGGPGSGRKWACFVDEQDIWIRTPPPPPTPAPGPLGIGVGLGGMQGGGSQPWVSCAQYGCCCGGTKCHS